MSSEWTGDKIRIRRRDLGLSQAELARRAGLTQGYVSLLERGRAGSPEALEALALALGLEPDEAEREGKREFSFVTLVGPRIPPPQASGARLHVDTWLRPSAGGDVIMVCPAGPRATLVFALDVAGHGPSKHAVATWLTGWMRGRLAGSPGTPRITELWAGLHEELNEIDEGAAFFIAILERWSDSHHIRYEGLTDGYPPPLLLAGTKPKALESCVSSNTTPTSRIEPRTAVHGDLRPPWRLVLASDGLLYRTGGGVESSGLRWVRRWQTGPHKDVPLAQRLESQVRSADDESMAVIRWNDWDFDTPFVPNDYHSHEGFQLAIQGMATALTPEKRQALAQALGEVLSNVARYASGHIARIRSRRLDDGTITVEVQDGGPGPSSITEGVGLSLVRELCDHVNIRASDTRGTTIELEMQPGGSGNER